MAAAPEIDPANPFGVQPDDVLALTSHVKVTTGAAAPATDTVFGGGGLTRGFTIADVERWIAQVSAIVDLKTRRRASLTDQAHRLALSTAARSVVAVGAAAYLVDAAFPANSSVNDSGAYGAVLWGRYKDELDGLVAMVEEATPAPVIVNTSGGIGGYFPPPAFPDVLRW